MKPDKREMIRNYISKALIVNAWDARLLGVVPLADNLDQPSVLDLEQMFDTTALAGRQHLLRRCGDTYTCSCTCSKPADEFTRSCVGNDVGMSAPSVLRVRFRATPVKNRPGGPVLRCEHLDTRFIRVAH